jgi:2-dehydro-3-deoxy-L-rhamnonate dehydrogenase (NAD+)
LQLNNIDLDGRTAIITGGAQGIGLAVAQRFLNSGAQVCLWDVDGAQLEQAATELSAADSVLTQTVDVTSPAAVAAGIQAANARFGDIAIMVNNAGISGPNLKTWDYPDDAWNEVINLDLNGVFYCCRAVVPQMIAANYGRIVNVASIAGKEGNPNASAYSAAKAGVIALTKSLGKELAEHNIAVNCVTPAAARTRIFDQMSQEHIDYMLSKIPRNRFLMVDEAAAMITWMACEENSFTTGAAFDISGGRATY